MEMIWVSGKGLGPNDRKVRLKDLSDGQTLFLCEVLKKISTAWRWCAHGSESGADRRKTILVETLKVSSGALLRLSSRGKVISRANYGKKP